jgi:hypothetical protein
VRLAAVNALDGLISFHHQVLDPDNTVRSYLRPSTVVHEAAHILACKSGFALTDNVLPDGFTSIAERAIKRYRLDGDIRGLSRYAYTNKREYWAESVSYFIWGETREVMRERSPEAYNYVRSWLNRTDLPEG